MSKKPKTRISSFLHQIDQGQQDWRSLARQVQSSVEDLFVHPGEGFLVDCLHTAASEPAAKAHADDALRPNQLLAITMEMITNPERRARILEACERLLIPGGIRSLADRAVTSPLEIVHNGRPLNDPYHPYQGRYTGDEDTSRKPAYHNGTAWTWPFPSFCEAWLLTYGPAARPTAQAWLHSASLLMDSGCLGQIPEIMDGDFPHQQRGCLAQAWGVSELLRVWLLCETLPTQ